MTFAKLLELLQALIEEIVKLISAMPPPPVEPPVEEPPVEEPPVEEPPVEEPPVEEPPEEEPPEEEPPVEEPPVEEPPVEEPPVEEPPVEEPPVEEPPVEEPPVEEPPIDEPPPPPPPEEPGDDMPIAPDWPVRGRMICVTDFGAMGDGNTDDTAAIQAALNAAFNGPASTFLSIPPGEYRVTGTLTATLADCRVHCGISAAGARINSTISGGGPVLRIGVSGECRNLQISGLDVLGRGGEGDGLRIEVASGSSLSDVGLRDLAIQGCGAAGLYISGAARRLQVSNSYLRGNKGSGAVFSGASLSGISLLGCILGDNGVHGAALIDGARDVAFHGCYLLLNQRFGLFAEAGVTLLSNCGFENNHQGASGFGPGNAAAKLGGSATLAGCTAYSIFKQSGLAEANVGGTLVVIGCTGHGSGNAKGAGLLRLTGGTGLVSLIGGTGNIENPGNVECIELGTKTAGAAFGGRWNSRSLMHLGDHVLWVDSAGKLRVKNGRPTSDTDGQLVDN